MQDLEDAIKSLKTGKCRDPEGLVRELYKEDVLGENLKQSLLILFNKIKERQAVTSLHANYNYLCNL